MALNEIIRKQREAQGLTQGQLAKKVGARQATISEFETGKRTIRSNVLEKIMNILDIKIESQA